MSSHFEAVIFDFDGLILDTETPDITAWQEIFREHGVEFPDAWWIEAIGKGVDLIDEAPEDLLARMLGKEIDRADVTKRYLERKMGWIHAEPIRPGVERALAEAKELGLRLAIASSSRHPWVDGHLARLGLDHHFEFVCCADDVPRPKPFPDLYLAATGALLIEPAKCVAIEDSPNGIKSAKAAGLACIAFPNPMTARLDISGADIIVDTLDHELKVLLARL